MASEYSVWCPTCAQQMLPLDGQRHAHEVTAVPTPGLDGCNVCPECVASLPCSAYGRRDAAIEIGLTAGPVKGAPRTFAPIRG